MIDEANHDFFISTDQNLLDIAAIHGYLSGRSYWAKGRPLETVRKSIVNSLCFGVYDPDRKMAGFGRVVTDYAVYACLLDVFILEEYRGRGLGKKLVAHILNYPELTELKRWQLATRDAHGLYARHGFTGLSIVQNHMEKVDPKHP